MLAITRKLILIMLFSALFLINPAAYAAKACKGLSKSSCSANSNCSWVKSYTTKTGSKVKAYCRTKSGKKKSTAINAGKDKKSLISKKPVSETKSKKNKTEKSDKKKTKKKSKKEQKDKKDK